MWLEVGGRSVDDICVRELYCVGVVDGRSFC